MPIPRPVACRELGLIYPSASIAALDQGLDCVTVNHSAAGTHGLPHYGGLTWDYVDDISFGDGFCAVYKPLPPRNVPGPFTGYAHSMATRTKMSMAKKDKRVSVVGLRPNGSGSSPL